MSLTACYERHCRPGTQTPRASNSPTSSPATCAAAPATGRSSTPASACSTHRPDACPTTAAVAALRELPRGAFDYAAPSAADARPQRPLLRAAHARRAGRACALAHPQARLLAGATDIGLWVNKQFRDLRRPDLPRRGGRAATHRRCATACCSIGAGASLEDAWAALARAAPALDRDLAALRVAADPQCRHDGRQRRQRLADRRQRAGADRARRAVAAAPR